MKLVLSARFEMVLTLDGDNNDLRIVGNVAGEDVTITNLKDRRTHDLRWAAGTDAQYAARVLVRQVFRMAEAARAHEVVVRKT